MRDYAHAKTDEVIVSVANRIRAEFNSAIEDAQEKLDSYLKKFKINDKKWRLRVSTGEKTEEEYKAWRKQQIMVGKRWEALLNQLSQDMHTVNVTARGIIIGEMPTVYAENVNYATYLIEKQAKVDTSFALYSIETVERLLRDNPELLQPPGAKMERTFEAFDAYKAGKATKISPKTKQAFDNLIAKGKDIRWQKGQIQSITLQSILQGESIPNMAKRIARELGELNRKSSVMYARTAMNSAQNAGREDAYKRAEELGVNIKKRWIATLDMRTRPEHRALDGQERGLDEPFEVGGYKIDKPGDPNASPAMVWGCRCTMRSVSAGWESNSGALRSNAAIGDMSYEEWQKAKPKKIEKSGRDKKNWPPLTQRPVPCEGDP